MASHAIRFPFSSKTGPLNERPSMVTREITLGWSLVEDGVDDLPNASPADPALTCIVPGTWFCDGGCVDGGGGGILCRGGGAG